MDLYVVIEPLYRESLWCTKYLEGLRLEAGKNSISIKYLDSQDIRVSPQEGGRQICAILGSTPIWHRMLAERLHQLSIQCISINPDYLPETVAICEIHIDYYKAMSMTHSYFKTNGKNRTVFFAVNSSSTSDMLKAKAFSLVFTDGQVCFQSETLQKSCETFITQYPNADSIICCNDLVAIALLKRLLKEKKAIPKDLWMVSFGKSAVADYIHPGLTSIEVAYEKIGRQIVRIAQILWRNPIFSTLSCKIAATLIPNETTDFVPCTPILSTDDIRTVGKEDPHDFYQDQTIQELNSLDNLFANILPVDQEILQGIDKNRRYAELAESLGISENTVKYRLKRMIGLTQVKNKSALLQLLRRYISL